MFTTEDQREEMLALKAKKPAANTATTVFSAPQGINPVGLNVGFRLENSALEAEEKSKLYADCSTIFAKKAEEEEKWGSPEESRYFRNQSIEMGMASREYGAKAQFFRELSYNPSLLYASPKGAPKPLTKAPSPMFRSAATTAATQPSGGFGNAQNAQIKPIRPMTTPQTATSGGTSPQRISGAGRATASDETALTLEKPNDWNEYLKKSARQVVLGNYTDDVTLGGTLVQIGLGLLGADLPADLRDIYYDWTHLKTTPWYQTLLDTVAILPGVGMIKFADEAATLLKHGDKAVDAVKAAGKASSAVDTAQTAAKTAGKTATGTKLPPEVIEARKKQLLEAIKENLDAHPMPDFAGKRTSKSTEIPTYLEKNVNRGIIKSFNIGKSLGAASKNYPVKMPDSKQHVRFVEGQHIEGTAFAGKGTNKEIRDRFRLESTYKHPASEWQKVSGKGMVVVDGKNRKVELHWYEANGQMEEFKIKRYLDDEG